MTIEQWLKQAAYTLQQQDISTARLDAEVLLCHIIGKDRIWAHAHPEFVVIPDHIKTLNDQIQRRATYEPLAYIIGSIEFYGPIKLTARPGSAGERAIVALS